MTNDLKIARAKTRLIFKYPFFGSCAVQMNFIQTETLETMATDGFSIFYNDNFVETITEEQVTGVVAHEVLHVVLKHCLRVKENKEKWNYACDVVVNKMLKEEGFILPSGAVYGDEKYNNWNAEKIYYDLPDSGFEKPEWGFVLQTSTESGKSLSEDQIKQIESDIDIKSIMAHNLAKSQGKEPGPSISNIIENIRKPKVNWKDALYRFVGGDNPDDYTWKRPNRKVFYTQNIYMPSVENCGVGNVIVALDTSGSVTNNELEQFTSEINNIIESTSPNSVTLIQCDTEIRNVKVYGPNEPIEYIECHGGGGTHFEPPFSYVSDNNLNVDNFIYLTDMYGSFPEEPDYPVLWVSTSDQIGPFGETIQLEINEA